MAWLRSIFGACRFCRRGDENLCLEPRFTGWHADGGYADYAAVDERFAYRLPAAFTDDELAPLLCAGIIGCPRRPAWHLWLRYLCPSGRAGRAGRGRHGARHDPLS